MPLQDSTLRTLLIAAIVFFTQVSYVYSEAAETPSSNDLARYVSIQVEIKDLNEAGAALRKATLTLANTLEHASKNLSNLSPEQLTLINQLATQVDGMIIKLDHSIMALPATIDKAREPSMKLLVDALETTRQQTVEPVAQRIETWIIITVIGLCVLGLGLTFGVVIALKQIGKFSTLLKGVTDNYRIVHIDQYPLPDYPVAESKDGPKNSQEPENQTFNKIEKQSENPSLSASTPQEQIAGVNDASNPEDPLDMKE